MFWFMIGAKGVIIVDEKLTLKERLILSNQYELLAKLSDDDYQKKQYENMSEIKCYM